MEVLRGGQAVHIEDARSETGLGVVDECEESRKLSVQKTALSQLVANRLEDARFKRRPREHRPRRPDGAGQ